MSDKSQRLYDCLTEIDDELVEEEMCIRDSWCPA